MFNNEVKIMFHIVLFEPEIPPNTGNIIRLCANTGCQLHLIEPLGFELDDKRLRRAGLDYDEYASVKTYANLDEYMVRAKPARVFALSTHGVKSVYNTAFAEGDVFLFGPETRGLPKSVLSELGEDHVLRIPMKPQSRSLNLSNTASILVFEAWRQCNFTGSR
ncbi:tRNA (cytidine(34)-2'-O)-methyltransferase [hydrothermal vent metagenome]|uniref:tRNA (Cytidine(34)-2'-O)-methyltransferase n=1 Tax=hydrothermal vent metagenome TaxID=652676 RepID=A0A3B1A353_9ZZZZ